VDNDAPKVEIINPWDDKQYLMEDDEWVSIDAEAVDNLSMGHVDFYLDRAFIGTTKVSPFSLKWNIKMTDALSATLKTAGAVSYKYSKQNQGGESSPETLSVPVVHKGERASATFPNGFSVIRDSGGYTETHTVKVRAFDAAGNSTESQPVRFLVSHKPKEKATTQLELTWARTLDDLLPRIMEPVAWLREERWAN
jgi:hypothetical protein